MGRTQRRRRRRAPRHFHTCSDAEQLAALNSWLNKQGMRCNEKLVLAVFDDTGRGVLTKKKIQPGEELMSLPLNSTLNVTTILIDQVFCSIFLQNNKCLVDYKQSVSFQSLMALYLVFLTSQGTRSKWHVYLSSLPQTYTVPYYLPNEMYTHIESDIIDVVLKQKNIILQSFHIFEDILKNNCSLEHDIVNFKCSFKLSAYEWAYFTVNTRCVYMDLSKVVDLTSLEASVLQLINDNTKISLCPYLDMINHSPHARNETKLLVGKYIANINITNVNSESLSDIYFSIYTKNNFDPFTQVFICYGDSHNLKLITEYGFCLPSKELDSVSFTFETIISHLESESKKLSQEQISFITSHRLNNDLYIDLRGLSFNLYGVLMVVKYYYSGDTDVSRLIYCAALGANDRLLNEIITPLVRGKLMDLRHSIDSVEKYRGNVILDNCVALMCNYVEILENLIKC